MAPVKRRTQAQRRSATRKALLEATIAALAERGYSQLTVADVCQRAGLSQGALFRHYPSRIELIAAATEEICARHRALVAEGLGSLGQKTRARELIATWRAAARAPDHAAWHEVMVAARSNAELHARVAPPLQALEKSLIEAAGGGRKGMVLLSVLHLLDSEAVTSAVYPNPELEAQRDLWLAELLEAALTRD